MHNLHPNDIKLYKTVVDAMWHVAKSYDLPLKSVAPMENPEYKYNPLGFCTAKGDIRIALRGKNEGVWDVESRREQDVWDTATHELAHLRHFNHGVQFQEFEVELKEAMSNRKVNYQQKVIDRLVKLQKQREGEAALGNTAAAEAFAGAINRMLIENELNPSDIDYARGADHDPVIELSVDFSIYQIDSRKKRIAWQETLASVVANAHFCSFFVQLNSNNITFVGTKSHATVAEYTYGTLVPAVDKMSFAAALAYWKETGSGRYENNPARGFRAAWTTAFIQRIAERFREAREAAVHAVALDINSQSQALMRLNGALAKTKRYIDDKFGMKRNYANRLNGGKDTHSEGRKRGRAAADRMNIGRRGLDGTNRSVRGHLED